MDSARSTTVIVQSTFDFAMREINALEHRIEKAEGDADAMLWDQAYQVAEQVKKKISMRKIAAGWFNSKGEPYSHVHVHRVALTVERYVNVTPRPRFRTVFNKTANIHHSSETAEHYTPPEILRAVKHVFGDIPDLDPCSNTGTPNVEAKAHFTIKENGLKQRWNGRVFLNPPYGRELPDWITKLREEWQSPGVEEIIALVPSRTDTEWFETLTADCDDIVLCFLSGRLTFIGNEDPAPFPSMVAYFGPKHDVFAEVFGAHGTLWQRPALEWFVNHAE